MTMEALTGFAVLSLLSSLLLSLLPETRLKSTVHLVASLLLLLSWLTKDCHRYGNCCIGIYCNGSWILFC